jgi:hypothetical protein
MLREWFKVGGIRELYRYPSSIFALINIDRVLCSAIHDLACCVLFDGRGLAPTIMGIIPYGAISFSTNEMTKQMVIHISCGAL